PMRRSTNGFCQGDRDAERTSSMLSFNVAAPGIARLATPACVPLTVAFGAENGPHIRSKRRELSHKSGPSAERLVRNEPLYRSWWYLVTGEVDDVRANRELGLCACEDRACLA